MVSRSLYNGLFTNIVSYVYSDRGDHHSPSWLLNAQIKLPALFLETTGRSAAVLLYDNANHSEDDAAAPSEPLGRERDRPVVAVPPALRRTM